MAGARNRIGWVHNTRESLRSSLRMWPAIAALGFGLLAVGLSAVRPDADETGLHVAWPGDRDSASTLSQVIATSVMTAITITFSLTVVALQMASQQFSPRLLREFVRDRFTKMALAIPVSTFVVAVVGLRAVADGSTPVLVAALAFVLVLLSTAAVLAFVGHMVRALRVDTMMVAVHREAVDALLDTHPALSAGTGARSRSC